MVGLASGDEVTVPSSVLFPSLAATLRVAGIGSDSFEGQLVTSITIPGNAEVVAHHVLQFANHFHQFHLRAIRDSGASKSGEIESAAKSLGIVIIIPHKLIHSPLLTLASLRCP
jgi:hypothetical protein